MKKVLFIDRDGTLIKEPPDEQVDHIDKLEFIPESSSFLSQIVSACDFSLVMVTNQDGLGTDSFPEDTFWPAHNQMIDHFKKAGVIFDEVLIDRSMPQENAPTRKPRTGLLEHYLQGDYDLKNSYVIGDRWTDMELAKNLGSKGILVGRASDSDTEKRMREKQLEDIVVLVAEGWEDIYQYLVTRR